MRDWVNFKVQQFNDDAYLKNELSALDNQTVKYMVSSLHSYLYKGESAKELETYIVQLLKREYAKNLASLIDSNKYIYCNNMADVFTFTNYFIQAYSAVYNLKQKSAKYSLEQKL